MQDRHLFPVSFDTPLVKFVCTWTLQKKISRLPIFRCANYEAYFISRLSSRSLSLQCHVDDPNLWLVQCIGSSKRGRGGLVRFPVFSWILSVFSWLLHFPTSHKGEGGVERSIGINNAGNKLRHVTQPSLIRPTSPVRLIRANVDCGIS